jgi:hypothetical protein
LSTKILLVALVSFGVGSAAGYKIGSDKAGNDEIIPAEKIEIAHDVGWFLDSANEAEFLRIYQECISRPNPLEITPECVNAESARFTALDSDWELAQKLAAIRSSLASSDVE